MIRIFEYTDDDGDGLTVESSEHGLWFTVRTADGSGTSALLTSEAAGKLRGALSPHDPASISELAEVYMDGRRDAIDDHNLVSREQCEEAQKKYYEVGYEDAKADLANLDPQRMAALEKAAEIAEKLRGKTPLGTPAVTAEQVVGIALYLLGQVNVPAVQQQ